MVSKGLEEADNKPMWQGQPTTWCGKHARLACLAAATVIAAIFTVVLHQIQPISLRANQRANSIVDAEPRVPVYYINLERSPERRRYMETMFAKYSDKLNFTVTRINAVDLKNMDDIADLLGLPRAKIHERILKFCNPISLLALTLSHLKAMAKAQEDNVDYAVIMEDDASFDLVPFWPKPVDQIAREVQEQDPEWDMVRLQYSAGQEGIFSGWNLLQNWKFSYPALPSVVNWRFERNDEIKKNIAPMPSLTWATIAILWSRKAIDRFASSFVNLNGRTVPHYAKSDLLSRFTFNVSRAFPEPSDCSYDSFLHTVPLRQYFATPPYFCYRVAEGSTGVRTGGEDVLNDHFRTHLASRMFAMQFMFEYLELQHVQPSRLPLYRLRAASPTKRDAKYAEELLHAFEKKQA